MGADRFTRRGGFCRLHAMFMNQSFTTWGLREELSSRSLFRVPWVGLQGGCHAPSSVLAHSITSSARASKLSGTVSPSALAVLRLITSSYLVGACTGKSAGFSPLRMRPS